jgi:hypothetical protein
MVVVPLSKPMNDFNDSAPRATDPEPGTNKWVRAASAGTLIAAGVLLMKGKHRAGLIAAATGTALTMLDHQDAMRSWWIVLPGYFMEVQRLLGQVQGAVDDIAVRREKLRRIIGR